MPRKIFEIVLGCLILSGCQSLNSIQPKQSIAIREPPATVEKARNDEDVWVPDKISKIWINSYVDDEGNMVEGHYKYVIIEPGHWKLQEAVFKENEPQLENEVGKRNQTDNGVIVGLPITVSVVEKQSQIENKIDTASNNVLQNKPVAPQVIVEKPTEIIGIDNKFKEVDFTPLYLSSIKNEGKTDQEDRPRENTCGIAINADEDLWCWDKDFLEKGEEIFELIKKLSDEAPCSIRLQKYLHNYCIPIGDMELIRSNLEKELILPNTLISPPKPSQGQINNMEEINACNRILADDGEIDSWHLEHRDGEAILKNMNIIFSKCKPRIMIIWSSSMSKDIRTSKAKGNFILQELGIENTSAVLKSKISDDIDKKALAGEEVKIIELRSGQKIKGKIVRRTTDSIEIDVGRGKELTYYLYLDEVQDIRESEDEHTKHET